jgi:hypothetical protein
MSHLLTFCPACTAFVSKPDDGTSLSIIYKNNIELEIHLKLWTTEFSVKRCNMYNELVSG